MEKQIFKKRELKKYKLELADSHCHLNALENKNFSEFISYGVLTIITNGTDTKSNIETLNISDNKHIFAALGIDPSTALNISDEELIFNIELIKNNYKKIVSIGEIGLDFKITVNDNDKNKQKYVFEKMLDLANELNLPVSIHSRNAIDKVIEILKSKNIKKVHFHFFEGDLSHLEYIKQNNYLISIPPFSSTKRDKVIKEIPMQNIMVESDAPAAGNTPIDVEKAIAIISKIKQIEFEKTAEIITNNTKMFFNIKNKANLNIMRK